MKYTRFLIFALLACSMATSCSTQKSKTTNDPAQQEIKSLINALASSCPPPTESDLNSSSLFEDEEINEEGDRIHQAYTRLATFGVKAFPYLIEASDDERYSFSRVYAGLRHHSVGEVCFMMIQSQVDFYGYGYKSRNGAHGRHTIKPQYLYHIRKKIGLDAWWQQRKNRTLRELQIESLLWTLEQEKSVGFTDETQRHTILDPLEERLQQLTTEPYVH